MISPEEIKQQALKWWKPLLQSHCIGETFFPKQIERIGKIQPSHITQRFEALQQEIEMLYQQSKNEMGKGYFIQTADRNFRRTGSHQLPDSIVFESIEDYLHVTRKQKEWHIFLQNYEQIIDNVPRLSTWIISHAIELTQENVDWLGILKVCNYFITTPRSNLYLRQLPIDVPTKFIEENSSLIQSLLDFLIPEHIRNPQQKKIAERYFLNFNEPVVRVRILDEALSLPHKMTDLSIPLSDFERIDWSAGTVMITENKMNFLTLPPHPNSIAIWSGGGFMISYLKNAFWLQDKTIYYWGDIDEHGFQILNQMRSYYPQTKSLMMDKKTFETFSQFTVAGERNKAEHLPWLNEEEVGLYRFLKSLPAKNRLEQEKITQSYADTIFDALKQSNFNANQ